MKIYIITIGNRFPAWVNEALDRYVARLDTDFSLVIKKIKPVSIKKNRGQNVGTILAAEAKKLASHIPKNSFTVALDEKGKNFDTGKFHDKFNVWVESGKALCFLIGGSDGIDKNIKSKSDFLLSLSPMTLTHHLALVVLTEQIYRVVSIMKNHPYHRS